MFYKSFGFLKDLEKQISESYSLPIFKGYKAVNKRGVEKLIDEIYANLPSDVKAAREYIQEHQIELKHKNDDKLYDNLRAFEEEMDKSFHFTTEYVIMNVKQIENILDRIYASMPQEIVESQKDKK